MLSCATFDPLEAAAGNAAQAVNLWAQSLVDRFGNFSLISNGLWNKTINITAESEGLECLYVPMDPDDHMFQKIGTYYGETYPATGKIPPDTEGAHIGYVIAGRNFPASTSCIIANVYYNYEVIADPTSAPILRASSQTLLSSSENREVSDAMSDMVKSNGLIRQTTKPKWQDMLPELVKYGVQYIPKIASYIGTLL
jgi:hypothetical protein